MGLTDLEIEDLILSILHQTKRLLVGREKPKSNMRVSLCLQPLVGYSQNYLTLISLHNLVSNPFSVCLIRFHPSSTVVWKELIPCSLWAQSVLRLHWNSLIKNDFVTGKPGEFNFDPLRLGGKNEKEQFYMKEAELFNGRLAMLAITGFATQEFVLNEAVVNQTPIFFKFFGETVAQLLGTGGAISV